jgi:hypothetical protein
MSRFKLGQSYRILFVLFVIIMLLVTMVSFALFKNGILSLVTFSAFWCLMVCIEVNSGIALDHKWVASYPRSGPYFGRFIAFHSAMFVVSMVIVIYSLITP